MNQPRRWPSRRLQIAVIIILVVAALIRGFMPPLSREGRAEKLYEDSWYAGLSLTGMSNPDSSEKAVKMLEKAIELEPGNSMYEQALVWQYPKDKLPELLNRPKPLGKEACILASGLIYEYAEKEAERKVATNLPGNISGEQFNQSKKRLFPGMPGYRKQFPPEYWQEKLQRLDMLIAADPNNAIPRYMRALVYSDMERPSDMLAEVKTGNRLNNLCMYTPEMSQRISNSSAGMGIIFSYFADSRELARRLNDYGNKQLRLGNVDSAIDILDECCLMGVKISSVKQASYISFMVSSADFSIGWKSLEPLYKDFGITGKLREYQLIKKTYADRINIIRDDINNEVAQLGRPLLILVPVVESIVITFICIFIALIIWGIMTLVRRVKEQGVVDLPAWSEGYLAKLFFLTYIPLAVIIKYFVNSYEILFNLSLDPVNTLLSDKAIYVIVAFQLVLTITILIVLRRRYIEHTGERISFLRFVFRVPSSVRAWRDRAFAVMFVGQLLFILCCGSVITLFYKSAYGAHPWQPMRIQYGMMSKEKAMVSKFSSELQKLIVVDSGNNGDNINKNLKPESE